MAVWAFWAMAGAVPVWSCYVSDKGGWQPYSPSVSAQLEASFSTGGMGAFQVQLQLDPRHGGTSHVVDLCKMVQINAHTGFQRPVTREGAAGALLATTWFWQDEHQSWHAYSTHASAQLSAAEAAGLPGSTLHNGKWSYWVDFHRGVQANTRTGTERPVRTSGPSTLPPTPALAPAAPALASTSSSVGGFGMGVVGGLVSALTGLNHSDDPLLEAWPVDFVATPVGGSVVDWQRLTRWTVVAAGGWAAGETDPITCDELGEGGEEVVRLPCHTASIPCTFNRTSILRSVVHG